MASEAARGTGKWGQAGIPHKGWTCVDIEDLGEPSVICEMCETQEIRYVHHMTHPMFETELEVGCVCAGKLEQDYEGAKQRETNFKNSQARKKNWLTRKWRASSVGNSYINVDGYNVVVYPDRKPDPQSWSFRVTNRKTGRPGQSRKPYPSEDAAKLRAFDALMWMKDQGR